MSKATYVGVDGKARKVKKMYIGVDGVARKIKKAYIDVGGVAKLFYSGTDPVLANNTWADIASVAASGEAQNYWSIGDTKTVNLNGTNYTFRIIGFDHDDLNSTDAMYGVSDYNGGKNKAAITFEMSEIFATPYKMCETNVNAGGWDASYMRSTAMPMMKGYMPTELNDALRTVSKLASFGSKKNTIVTSADQLFLLSEIEALGTYYYSFAGEGSQYAYYKAGNSCIKKKSGSVASWWLRSPRSNSYDYFNLVNSSGAISTNYANNPSGVSFAFCI